MSILSFLPNWFLLFFIHGMVILGLILTFGGALFKYFPPITPYATIAKQIGIVLLVVGVFFEGGYATEKAWRKKVEDLQEQVKIAEAKSEQANIDLNNLILEKNNVVKEVQVVIQERIVRESAKIDANCVVSPQAILILNDAARNKK